MVSLDEARLAVAERLRPSSLEHCERTAEAAVAIATAYGLDSELAALAGLLHDWGRDESDEQMVDAAARYGIVLTDVDRSFPYLLHARVGAAQLAESFPTLPLAVLGAVASHTLGRVGASDLEKALYVADTIEAGRRPEGLEGLREAVGEVTLTELFTLTFAHTLRGLVDKRRRIHPGAVEVWNSLTVGRPS